MNKSLLFILATVLLTACAHEDFGDISTQPTPSDKIFFSDMDAAKGTLLVRVDSRDSNINAEGVELTVEPLFPKETGNEELDRWKIVHFDEALDLKEVAELIAINSNVERVEFNFYVERIGSQSLPMPTERPEITRANNLPFNDPELEFQWHYYNNGRVTEHCVAGADINLFNAWKYTAGDNRVIVAVMDGGIMYDHKDLKDNMWVNEKEKSGTEGIDDDKNGYIDDIYGYNFANSKGEIIPDSHGTHVAGTISAVNNNGYAVCGIAGGTGNGDGVRLMSLQIFVNNEGCAQHKIAQAFYYAADNGAVIANNSWGYKKGNYTSDSHFENWDSVLKTAIDYFETNAGLEGTMEGGIAIFAAGNESLNQPNYPGAYHKYICVSAMAPDYTASDFTNYGPGTNICAPGGDNSYGTMSCISSTSLNPIYGYEYNRGTSMATPHVSGCAALAVSYALKRGYSLTTESLRELILTSVHDINTYQTGTRKVLDFSTSQQKEISLAPYIGQLGSGYIDAHRLLMQMDNTPCLYFATGESSLQSVDAYFGSGAKGLTYDGCSASEEVKAELGITELAMEEGMLRIKCTKPGSGRITVRAIIGGEIIGGGSNMGGMVVEREFEVVVRGAVAENGGWL